MSTVTSWRRLAQNEILDGDGFFISYRSQSGDIGGLPFVSALFCGDEEGGAETALVKRASDGSRSTFFILNGDFRKDYERLVPDGFAACLTFYKSKAAKHRSSWSEDAAQEVSA